MSWIKHATREPALLILVLIFLLLFPALFRPYIHGSDTVGYYAWTRSAVIDRTLDVKNTFYHYSNEFGDRQRERDIDRKTASGYTHNQWAAGCSILWAPGFLIAHAAVKAAGAFGAAIPADGYSWPYPLAASLSSALFGLFVLCMTYSIARRLTGQFSAGLAVIVVWLATPMVFYMYCHPLMSHTNDAFVNALFVYVWWKTRDIYSTKAGLARGLAAGLATWVRTQDAALIVILGLEVFADLLIAFRHKRSIKPAFFRGLATLGGYLLLFVPLLVFWRIMFGSWLTNTYNITQGPRTLDWRGLHVFSVLFSSNRGLFIWAPITLPSLIGLRWLFKENARLAAILSSMFVAQLYIVSSWFGWAGGAAFGPRFWVGQTVIFALGLAALAKAMRGPMILHAVAGSAFIVWNFLLIVQYVLETIPRYGPVDLGLMVRNQFMVIPENLRRVLQSLMNRGR
jgi:hypothetical protein